MPARPAPEPADTWETEDDTLEVPVSALEHYSYCPRQCALIHVEQTYDENLYTIRGKLLHERVDSGDGRAERGVRTVRAMPLWSQRWRLQGKADVVEFHGRTPYPVEYKSGPYRPPHADVQLCAQALCLEEMLNEAVPMGAIYAFAERRRHEVVFTSELRAVTIAAVAAVRSMLAQQQVPPAVNDSRCRQCSLLHSCLPSVLAEAPRLRGLQGALFHPWGPGQEDGP